MRYINTSEDSITFIDVDGKQLIVPKNKVYTSFNTDTVTFLLIERYDNEGICLFTSRAEDLEINGTTYTFEQLLDGEGIGDLFSPTGLSFEVVEELPQSGEEGTIYLVPNDHDTYTEYIWIAEEEKWEAIGDSDIDLSNYYTKTESDARYATQTVVNQEIAARIQGDADINTTLTAKADKSDTYTKTQVDTALSAKANAADVYTKTQVDTALATKVSQTEFDTKEEVVSTALNDLEENKQDKLTAGANITIDANNVISATGGGDYVDVPTFNQKETAIAQALTDLNENKADKSEIPVVPDMSNYYTKTESNNTFVSQADFDVKEEVISTALNTLNTSKADASSVYTKSEIDAMIGNINTILASI